nr:MFS transporter [Candidatus Delongbacteria bacterium]
AMRIARTTYLKKIADHPGEILPSLALGITMDHVVSMTIPVLGGLAWFHFGYQSVFYGATGLAVLSWLVALRIRIPEPGRPSGVPS